jgi:hypothetical protein
LDFEGRDEFAKKPAFGKTLPRYQSLLKWPKK